MRLLIAGALASLLAENIDAQTPPTAAAAVATREVRNVVPASAAVEQFVIAPDSLRTYYRLTTGGIWMYDRNTNATTRIMDAMVWDLALSPTRDLLAYTKVGESPREQHVWVLPLSPSTGLSAGKERRVSTHAGDVPTISPDGKQIAFARDDETGVGQTVVIVPVAGGTERVIAASQPSGVSNIRWAPDGKAVYFGVNPPVPFTCAESCLTGARESRPSSTIRRVGSAGGSVQTIATVGAPGPGLSPDGKYMVFGDSGSPRRLIVADANGNRLKAFSVPSTQVPVGWTGTSTLLTLTTGQARRLRAVAIPGGTPRVLFESTDFIFMPSWTPDGRSVGVVRFANGGCELNVKNADGAAQRTIVLAKVGGCGNASWTSDQRWVVFTHFRPNDKPAVVAVEAATGQSRQLRTLADESTQWVLDRDVVVLLENVRDPSFGSKRAVWQVDLTGNAKVLRELPAEDGASITLVDRNRVIIARVPPRDFRLVMLTSGETRTISAVTSGSWVPRPYLSADGEWMGYLAGLEKEQFTKVELVKLDGTARRTIDLGFSAQKGSNVLILSGGTGAVVTERREQGQPNTVYLVSTSGPATKLLVSVGQPAEFTLSPDGRTLLYLLNEQLPPVISAVDITTIR